MKHRRATTNDDEIYQEELILRENIEQTEACFPKHEQTKNQVPISLTTTIVDARTGKRRGTINRGVEDGS